MHGDTLQAGLETGVAGGYTQSAKACAKWKGLELSMRQAYCSALLITNNLHEPDHSTLSVTSQKISESFLSSW